MRVLSLVPLTLSAAFQRVRAVVLTTSSTYVLTVSVGGTPQALTHPASHAAFFEVANVTSSAANQVWTVVVDSQTATLQNVGTLAFLASESVGIVPSSAPFSWTVVPSGAQNLLCVGAPPDGSCLTIVEDELALVHTNSTTDASKLFTATAVPPPAAGYMIHNLSRGVILGASFPPSPVSLDAFPATDRHGIWTVDPASGDPTLLAIVNFDSSGPLNVNGSGVVAAFPRVQWQAVFFPGVGTLLAAPGSSGAGVGLVLTAAAPFTQARVSDVVDVDSAWVFQPVNLEAFEP